MSRRMLAWGLGLALGVTGVARAQERDPGWTYYLGVLGTYGFLDEARAPNINEGLGPTLLYGLQRSDGWGFELQGFGSVHETGGPTTDFYRWGLGGDLVYTFGDRRAFSPFVLAGVAYAYNDVSPDALDDWDWGANAGLGFVTAPVFRDFFRVRVEGRAIYDDYGAGVAGEGFVDFQAGIGVEFMPAPLPAAPPDPAERVRVVEVATGLTDGDGDGVVDGRDHCPDTPPGARVDGLGCPLPRVWRLNGVTFEVDQARLRPDAMTILKDVAAVLLRYPDMDVEIAGHTDSTGGERYNERLSLRRAESVRHHLVTLGVPAARLEVRGYGEHEPVHPNRTAAGRELNRRVELHIVGGSGVPELRGKP